MEAISGTARNYLDFAGLGELRARAQNHEQAATRDAAQQFESMFVHMMLKSMRAAVMRSELIESSALDTYEAMFDRELSVALARRGGLGLAEQITAQLSPAAPAPHAAADALRQRAAFGLMPSAEGYALPSPSTDALPLGSPQAFSLRDYAPRSLPLAVGVRLDLTDDGVAAK